MDDYRAHRHAVNTYSVRALSVSQCLVGFLYRGILTLDDAEQTFQQLKQLGATNAIFLQQAAQAIYAKGGSMLWP